MEVKAIFEDKNYFLSYSKILLFLRKQAEKSPELSLNIITYDAQVAILIKNYYPEIIVVVQNCLIN